MGRMREIIDTLPVHMNSPYVFWHSDGQRYHNLASQYLRIRRQANRIRQENNAKPITITFHGFRHRFAINWIRREGIDRLPSLSKILGHTSIKTTEWYLEYVAEEEVTKEVTAETA